MKSASLRSLSSEVLGTSDDEDRTGAPVARVSTVAVMGLGFDATYSTARQSRA
jgi:hypothetical protein